MESATKPIVIDADAHVVESARTWEFMDPSEKQFRPIPLETREEDGIRLQFWVIDGKVRGFRFPAFSPAELEKRSRHVGRKFADEQESREYGMFVTCENSDDLPYVVRVAGEDCLVVGTDYGHTDISSDVDAIKIFRARTDLTPEVKRKILSDNPQALYAL